MNINVRNVSADANQRRNARAAWMRQLRTWHWISGALCLAGMLMFAVTGITLNHAGDFEGKAKSTARTAQLGDALMAGVAQGPATGRAPVDAPIAAYLDSQFNVDVRGRPAEWSKDEVYISMPRPGGDGWISIDRETGEVRHESTDRGWIAYLNDLHKGRHTGAGWSLFIDIFAAACVVFCVTGLLLLQLYASGRKSTWPIVGMGILLPILVAIFLIH
ncbi:MAG: PepSY-associated TM helix domain-containing protein [Hyphomicrobiaceae bacterium]